jgi:hypothetical protein
MSYDSTIGPAGHTSGLMSRATASSDWAGSVTPSSNAGGP